MKVIGKADDMYICLVGHSELEKLTDKYYGKMKRLELGAEMNLGAGYDFRDEIMSACDGIVKGHDKFQAALDNITKFAVMVANLPKEQA